MLTTALPPIRSPKLGLCGKTPTARFSRSEAAGLASSRCELRRNEVALGEAQAHHRTQSGSRGGNCQTDTPFTPIPEGPAHRNTPAPSPRPARIPVPTSREPGTSWFRRFLLRPPLCPLSNPVPPALTPPLRRSPQLSKRLGFPTASTSSLSKTSLTQRCPTVRGLLFCVLGTAQLPALVFRG